MSRPMRPPAPSKNGLGGYFDYASRDRIHDLSLCTDTLSSWFKYACPVASMPLFSELAALADRVQRRARCLTLRPSARHRPALAWLQRVDKEQARCSCGCTCFRRIRPTRRPRPGSGSFDASGDARRIRDTEPHWGYELGSVSDARVQVLAARYDESVAYADHYAGEFLQQRAAAARRQHRCSRHGRPRRELPSRVWSTHRSGVVR